MSTPSKLAALSPQLKTLGTHALGGSALGAGLGAAAAGEGNRTTGALVGGAVGGIGGGVGGKLRHLMMEQAAHHGDEVGRHSSRIADLLTQPRGYRDGLGQASAQIGEHQRALGAAADAQRSSALKGKLFGAAGVGAGSLAGGLAGGMAGTAQDVINAPGPYPQSEYYTQGAWKAAAAFGVNRVGRGQIAERTVGGAPARYGVEKTAVLGTMLGMGALGHLGVNALGRSAHHGSNLASVLAHKGLQHGMGDAKMNRVALQSLKMVAGPEATVPYEVAQALGKKIMEQPPLKRKMLIEGLRKEGPAALDEFRGELPELAGDLSHTPILGPLSEALEHEIAGTAPALQAKGLGAKAYSTLVDKMTNLADSPFSTTGSKAVNATLGALPAAAFVAKSAPGAVGHFAVNLSRQAAGATPQGKQVMKSLYEQGAKGVEISPLKEKVIDYAVSPSVLDPYRVGKTVRTHVVPAAQDAPMKAHRHARAATGKDLDEVVTSVDDIRNLGTFLKKERKAPTLAEPVDSVPDTALAGRLS